MKIFKLTSIVIFIITLAGCDTTGGIIGGLFPAPKFLKGEIENNVYMAKDSIFSIASPHKEDTYEYTYLQIKEQYKNNDAYVSFGPAAFNRNIYRVEVSIYPKNTSSQINLEEVAPKIISDYSQQLQAGYSTAPEATESKIIKINGFDAYYQKMTHNIPAGKYMSNTTATVEHHIYVINYGVGAGIAWVQIPIDPPSHVNALSPIAFAESLKLLPNKSLVRDSQLKTPHTPQL